MAIKNYFSSTGSWAKHAAIIAVLSAMGALLGSCGGGGPASTAPAPLTPLGVLPSAADVFADVPVDFRVSGGTGPYTTASSNIVAVPAPTISGSNFTIFAKSVNTDTAVTITVKDSLGVTTAASLSVKPTTLNNTVTLTPVAPTGTGCGSGLCSGGDARVVVTAVVNGIKLTNRPIRFDVFQGDFRFVTPSSLVTPGTNPQVTSLTINTDENGEAVARIQAIVTAPTQVATLTSTDTVSGLVRRTNFNIVQTTSGTGILSVLPGGSVTFTGSKPAAGQPAQCPGGNFFDTYIYGGTPPYQVVSPFPLYLTVSPSIVMTNGGSYRVTTSGGCGSAALIVTDAQNRVIETPLVIGVLGPVGDALPPVVPPTALTVTPTTQTLTCGQTGTSVLAGSGTYTSTVTTVGVPSGSFTVTPASGNVPGTISFTRNSGVAALSPTNIAVSIVSGTFTATVNVTVPASCP